jgi:hypothetical protein
LFVKIATIYGLPSMEPFLQNLKYLMILESFTIKLEYSGKCARNAKNGESL